MTVLLQPQLPSLAAEHSLQALCVPSPSCHILQKYKKILRIYIPHNQVKIDVVSLAIPTETDVPSQGVSPKLIGLDGSEELLSTAVHCVRVRTVQPLCLKNRFCTSVHLLYSVRTIQPLCCMYNSLGVKHESH